MNKPITKFYFNKSTGDIFFETSAESVTTIEQDIATFTALSERNRETFDVIELPFGAYQQDFAESVGYRVDVDALAELPEDRRGEAIVFSVADPENPEVPIELPKPLSVQIEELKDFNVSNMLAMTEMYEEKLVLEERNKQTMLALTELYEIVLGGN
ncbi:hypothetical protein [Bacillus infantis]|uniref:hypothetical protein n=1 Tax=Bacillus infantis TaxID=324767 RepID=UPI003CEFAF27